jgi:hypothetical protein
LAFGASGKAMRMMPALSFVWVERTVAGRPPRASAHLRISSWSVVTFAWAIFDSSSLGPALLRIGPLTDNKGGERRVQLGAASSQLWQGQDVDREL